MTYFTRLKPGFMALIYLITIAAFAGAVSAAENGAVLFDNAHLESIGNANWTITGGYSDFADTIKAMGWRVDENTNQKITLDYLKKYDAFIVPEPNTKFNPDEEQAIVEYVKGGGGLYMVADHAGADRNNDGWDAVKIFNNFSTPFGLKFADKWVKKEMPIRGKIEQDAVTYKLKYCGTWGGTVLEILDPAIARGHVFLSEPNGGGPYLATANYGAGRVVAFGDSSPLDDGTGDKGSQQLVDGYNLLEADHRQLAINTMCFLLNKKPEDYPIKLKFYFEGGKLNCNPGEQKEFPLVLMNQTTKEYSNIIIDFYKNRPMEEKMKFYSMKVDRIAAGEKLRLMMPFKQDDRQMFVLYTTVTCGEDKTANITGFNSIMVGVPIMFFLDSFHENDYNNRIKMLKNAVGEDGIFFTRSKFAISDRDLTKVDVVAINAPKAGMKLAPEEVVALINHLKKGRGLILNAKGPDSNWGDNAGLNELLKELSIPASFEAHPEFKTGGGKPVEFEVKKNDYIFAGNFAKIMGESPSCVKIDETELKKKGFTYQVITTLPGSEIPVGVVLDGSKSNTGFNKIALFGSFHMSDGSYQMSVDTPTHYFNIRTIRALAPEKGAFASNASQPGSANAGGDSKTAGGPFLRGVAKVYANGSLFIEDFGVKKEIRIMHGLSEEKALVEFAKIKGKLIKVNLRPDISEPTTDGFNAIEYRK